MRTRDLVFRSLLFYWRSQLSVVLGVTVAAAVLAGALLVGDSVRYTLREIALARLGGVDYAISTPNRYFRAALASDVASASPLHTAPILHLAGSIATGDGSQRVHRVQVYGVDERFWTLGAVNGAATESAVDGVAVNQRLAQKLGLAPGSEAVLRVEKPGLLPRDAPLSTFDDSTISVRLEIDRVAADSHMGRFNLRAEQIAPYNLFVPLEWLQERTELVGKANLLLAGVQEGTAVDIDSLRAVLAEVWTLADIELRIVERPAQQALEINTGRIFFDRQVVDGLSENLPQAVGAFTYLTNEIRLGDRAVPYSMVTGMGPISLDAEDGGKWDSFANNLADDEIVINEWLADDLNAKPGGQVELSYYTLGPLRELQERAATFKVRNIVPIRGAAFDPGLMPDYPGLADSDNCRDWDPGFDVDLDQIRERDELYWDTYKGTPKAFITLAASQKLWGNRFGNLTAIRIPVQGSDIDALSERVRAALSPSDFGLVFQPVRLQAIAASSQALDFAPLFLGLSFFLMAAAILLTALLFVFTVEQRASESGTLLALGFSPQKVRRFLMMEGLFLSSIGSLAGICLGFLYTRIVLYGLGTVWGDAVSDLQILFHAETSTIIYGFAASVIISQFSIWVVLRKQIRRPARELIAGSAELVSVGRGPSRQWRGFGVAVLSAAGAVGTLVTVGAGSSPSAAGGFMAAGALLLLATLLLSRFFLTPEAENKQPAHVSMDRMAIRNCTRRRGRSLACIALLACGSFLVISVGANRHDPLRDAENRSSGTGGFGFFGEMPIPLLHDLNTEAGCNVYGLSREELDGVDFVPIRVRDGDDASCLNLNRAQTPRLLGVNPEFLQGRHAFTFVNELNGQSQSGWELLESAQPDGSIPAVADQSTVLWALGKSIGDTLLFQDETGREFTVRIVGALANSILQGNLVLAEDRFIERYPSESGYRMLLVDAPHDRLKQDRSLLERALQDHGLVLMPAYQRLAAFQAVENTYLSIFQALGGLGLILGSLGLGVVVLRNMMERRSELAVMIALGFRKRAVERYVLLEHGLLLVAGLFCGCVSAGVAVWPVMIAPGGHVPYLSIIGTLAVMAVSGTLWIWLAVRFALRGPILQALRNE